VAKHSKRFLAGAGYGDGHATVDKDGFTHVELGRVVVDEQNLEHD
jgi:hypothetical protein